MISEEKLIEKKNYYETKKAEVIAKDFTAEITQEVDDFKAVKAQEIEDFKAQKEQEIKDFEELTVGKYESGRREDIKTCDHYIEFVDMLLTENAESKKAEEEGVENAAYSEQIIE